MTKQVLFLALLLTLSVSWHFNNPYQVDQLVSVMQDTYWLDQYVDHFNYNSNATFKQRYYVLNTFYKAGGPVYLYICGEAECRGISETSYTAQIASKTNGLLVALEHRFYGKTMPFGDESMETKNLKFLTSQQALSDIAYFITYIKKNGLHGVSNSNKWITVGGSYAGAMSAWFRSKYPHLTVGAIGSSGVVLAVQDFSDFDQQIYQSALKNGAECPKTIQEVNKMVEDIIASDSRVQFQAEFKAQKLSAPQFLFYWVDVIVFQFQYSRGGWFCENIVGKSTQQAFQFIKSLALTVSPTDYSAFYLKNASYAMYVYGYLGKPWAMAGHGFIKVAHNSVISRHQVLSTL